MINKALLIEQLKRFWLVSLLFCTLFFGLMLLFVFSAHEGTQTMRGIMGFLKMEHTGLIFVSLALPVTVAACVFSFLYNRKASTLFYTLPLNRNQLFATNALAGIILCMIPVIFMSLLMLIPVPIADNRGWFMDTHFLPDAVFLDVATRSIGDAINPFPVVALFFLRLTLTVLFYFALSWLAFTLAGNFVIGILTAFFINILPTGLFVLTHAIADQFVFGMSGMNVFAPFETAIIYSSPLAWYEAIHRGVSLYAHFALVTVALFAGAWVAGRLRHVERTGDSIIFSPVKHLLIFLVSISFSIIIGMFIWTARPTPLFFHLGLIIGLVIGLVISQMIAEKSFQIGSKLKTFPYFIGVALVLYGGILFITQIGMLPFINHVPARDEIVGVSVSRWWHMHQSNRFDPETQFDVFVRNPEIIDMTVNAHQAILTERSDLDRASWRRSPITRAEMDWYFERGYSPSTPFHISYLLESGRVVTRSYDISGIVSARIGLDDIMHGSEMILAAHPSFTHHEIVNALVFWYTPRGYWNDGIERRRLDDPMDIIIRSPVQISELMYLLADIYVEQRLRDAHTNVTEYRPASFHVQFSIDWANAPRGNHMLMGGMFIDCAHVDALREILIGWGYALPNFSDQ